MQLVWIGLFGAAGCIGRYLLSGWVYQVAGRGLPWGTLSVNLLGSFVLGVLMEAGLRHDFLPPMIRVGVTVGFMGGFTTFSTFSYETMRLLEEGDLLAAASNVSLNLLLCLLGAGLGIWLMRQL